MSCITEVEEGGRSWQEEVARVKEATGADSAAGAVLSIQSDGAD